MPTDVVVTQCECRTCHHKWYPRKPGRPKTCPKCRTCYWDEPYQRPPAQPDATQPDGDSG